MRPKYITRTQERMAVAPAIFTVALAAQYLSVSRSTINAWRARDVKLLRQGLEPLGPRWCVVSGTRVMYRRADLDAWLDANARPLAVIEFANRGKNAAD